MNDSNSTFTREERAATVHLYVLNTKNRAKKTAFLDGYSCGWISGYRSGQQKAEETELETLHAQKLVQAGYLFTALKLAA